LQLDFFNNLLDNIRENNVVKNFTNELSDYLEKLNRKTSHKKDNGLKQEGCIYQVIDMGIDGAFLQNVSNNKITYETDISKGVLNQIGNDTVLKYEKNKYIIEDELTQEFLDNLVEIKEYEEIKNSFIKESNILKNDPNTKYKIELKNKEYSVLSYETDKKHTLKVPKELIPFWAKCGENLYYQNGNFNRVL
jgi:hypothetical protein